MAPTPPKPRRRRIKRSRIFVLVVAFGLGSIFLLPTLVLLLISLLPTLVAFLTERSRRYYALVTIGAMNAAGAAPVAITLWQGTHSMGHAMDLLTLPLSWLPILVGAAIGWGIYKGVPSLIVRYMTKRSRARIETLRTRQTILVEEWGEEVAGEMGGNEFGWEPYKRDGESGAPEIGAPAAPNARPGGRGGRSQTTPA
jgi:fumarate reductase subunit D